MPSPHTLGSIMHQPLAAPTPLLLFPLENRTSTHPPSTPVRPLRFSPPPLSSPSSATPASVGAPLPLFLSLSLWPSLSHSRASQVQQKPTPSPSHHPRNSVSVQRGVGSRPSFVSRATISATPSPSSIFSAMRPSRSRPCFLSLSLLYSLFPVSPCLRALHPFLDFAGLSLAPPAETSLAFVAISVSSCPSRRHHRRHHFRGSHALRRFIHPLCSSFSDQEASSSRSPSIARARIPSTFSYLHPHTQTPVPHVLVSPSRRLSSPRSFFTLSQPLSYPSVSASRGSSSASLLSHPCPENPPFSTH